MDAGQRQEEVRRGGEMGNELGPVTAKAESKSRVTSPLMQIRKMDKAVEHHWSETLNSRNLEIMTMSK